METNLDEIKASQLHFAYVKMLYNLYNIKNLVYNGPSRIVMRTSKSDEKIVDLHQNRSILRNKPMINSRTPNFRAKMT